MDTIYFYLFVAVLLHLIGAIIFGRFEIETALPKRFFKVAFMVIGTALAYTVGGSVGGLLFPIGMMLFGLSVHVIWCRSHAIHPVTAEPRARYYQLRGWT